MRTADVIWQMVKDAGVDTVFMLPGGGCSYLVDALGSSGLNIVSSLHEQGAGYEAVGYAMMKGLGVVLTTSGPGATNAVTPCWAAFADSVPLIVISGQVPTGQIAPAGMRSRGVQEAPTMDIVRPITKIAERAVSGADALELLDVLIHKAKAGRMGPCWMDVPQDVQGMEVAG